MNTSRLFEEPTLPASTTDPGAVRVSITPLKTVAPDPMLFRHYTLARRPDGSLWELGRGGMGVTYKAVDTNLHTPVALKIIGPQCFEGERSRHRFVREARLAALIRHPNVAAVHHLESEGDDVFYAMEFVDGITAHEWVAARGRMPVELALDVAMQVSRALTAAEKLQLVHRDIKPGNIMLLADPADARRVIVKVIDFGLARTIEEDEGLNAITCSFAGTPQFASPEQIESLEPDVRSDIYSLGCVLWFLLAGEPPFSGSAARVMAQHLTSELKFNQLVDIPAPVRDLLSDMLQKEPRARPQSAVALHTRICACRGSVGRHRAPSLLSRQWNNIHRWHPSFPSTRTMLSMAACVILLLGWLTSPLWTNTETAVTTDFSHVDELSSVEELDTQPAALPSFLQDSDWNPPEFSWETLDPHVASWMTAEVLEVRGVELDGTDEMTMQLTAEGVQNWQPIAGASAKDRAEARRPGSVERRTAGPNPLQRAGRTVRGFINRIF